VAEAGWIDDRRRGERRTRADALKDAIAQAILSGVYAPGQRLDEVSVAQRFAVSRTPVREALKQLAAMDLVEIRPHRGAVVAAVEPARLAELVEAIGEIEAVCARLAAERMDAAAAAMRCHLASVGQTFAAWLEREGRAT
jgi:DNA-binding GntR family transcriptional regulator